MNKEIKICVLCKAELIGMGHNPEPLASGRCCDNCNSEKVIPYRLWSIVSWRSKNKPSK